MAECAVMKWLLQLQSGDIFIAAVRDPGTSQLTIRFASVTVSKLLGWPIAELQGRRLCSLFVSNGPSRAKEELRELERVILNTYCGRTHATVIKYQCSNGCERPLLTSVMWLAEVVILQASAVTVCEPPTQQLIRDIMRISHDMRTPLACVLMATNLLLEDKDMGFTEFADAAEESIKQQELARKIVREISGRCQLLLARARMTLELHKIESGEAVSSPTPTDVRRELIEVAQVWLWDRPLDATNSVEVDRNVPDEIMIDREKFTSLALGVLNIMMHLVDAALSARGASGPMAREGHGAPPLGLPRLRLSFSAADGSLTLRLIHSEWRSGDVSGSLDEMLAAQSTASGGRAEQALRYCNGLCSVMGSRSGVRCKCISNGRDGTEPCLEAVVFSRPPGLRMCGPPRARVTPRRGASWNVKTSSGLHAPGGGSLARAGSRRSSVAGSISSLEILFPGEDCGEDAAGAGMHSGREDVGLGPCFQGARKTRSRSQGHWLLPRPRNLSVALIDAASVEQWRGEEPGETGEEGPVGMELERSDGPLSDDAVIARMSEAVLKRSRNFVIVSGLDRKYEYVSESFRVFSGLDPASMLGKTMPEQVHSNDRERVDKCLTELRDAALSGEKEPSRRISARYRVIPRESDAGEYAWLNTCATIDTETQKVFAISMEDHTYIEQQSTLVQLLAELGADMQTSLEAIEGQLSRLTHIPCLATNANTCARLACVEHSCATLEGLASTALQVARLQGADVPQVMSPVVRFNAEQLLSNIVGMCSLSCKNGTRISLGWGGNGAPSCKLMGNKRGLNDIVMNFLSNAVKFCDGSAVHLEGRIDGCKQAGNPDVDGEDKRIFTVSVSDGGRGMTPAQCASVFEPYTRCSDDRGGGNGLGLAIAKATATSMGGSVSCSSEGPGKGSRFEVSVPVVLAPRNRPTRLPAGATDEPRAAEPPPPSPHTPMRGCEMPRRRSSGFVDQRSRDGKLLQFRRRSEPVLSQAKQQLQTLDRRSERQQQQEETGGREGRLEGEKVEERRQQPEPPAQCASFDEASTRWSCLLAESMASSYGAQGATHDVLDVIGANSAGLPNVGGGSGSESGDPTGERSQRPSQPQRQVQQQQQQQGSPTQQRAAGWKRPAEGKLSKLLLVDDDRVCLMLGAVCLRRQGLEVETASSGEEAFQKVQRLYAEGSGFDAVLTDYNMPGCGGLGLCQLIREWEGQLAGTPGAFPRPPLLIAAVTGELSDEVIALGDEFGLDLWFEKPFRPDEVVRVVSQRLEELGSADV